MTALTKAEMAERLFEELGLNKREAKEMVEMFFEEIRHALENNESVKLSGFGNFDLRDKRQRPGRNPKTGEEIPITARRVVTFHASQKLKALVESLNALHVPTPDIIDIINPLTVRCGVFSVPQVPEGSAGELAHLAGADVEFVEVVIVAVQGFLPGKYHPFAIPGYCWIADRSRRIRDQGPHFSEKPFHLQQA